MKNLMLFVHPSKDFLPEHKIAINIQIDNLLNLGWKSSDIILATNFAFEYNGVKSILVSDDNYNFEISPCAPIINVINELFDRNLIADTELYWYHDEDVFQLSKVNRSELDLGTSDVGWIEWPNGVKISASSFFFKSSAKDIFSLIKEIMYKYRVDEEVAMSALYTNNKLWVSGSGWDAQQKFVPLNFPGAENVHKRVKKLNITYDFETSHLDEFYSITTKPIKTAHFHFMKDRLLDSAMYGKNSLKKIILPERLIKIFHKHGVKGVPFKKMKNLMIHISPEKKFTGQTEDLVKKQIDNSLNLGWKKEDIVLVSNFPYQYQGVKSIQLDKNLFESLNAEAYKSNAIFQLLTQGIVKEAEFWWYHDLDVFQIRKIKSPEINLEDTFAGFMTDGSGKFDTSSFFFRKESDKIFEWIRNKTRKMHADDKAAFASLIAENYHHINSKIAKLNFTNNFAEQNED